MLQNFGKVNEENEVLFLLNFLNEKDLDSDRITEILSSISENKISIREFFSLSDEYDFYIDLLLSPTSDLSSHKDIIKILLLNVAHVHKLCVLNSDFESEMANLNKIISGTTPLSQEPLERELFWKYDLDSHYLTKLSQFNDASNYLERDYFPKRFILQL